MGIEDSKTAARVYALLRQVPAGRVTTYGALAKAAGIPKSARLVGAIMRGNPDAPRVPCHRVVKSDGGIGGYSGSAAENIRKKVSMLESEGVKVRNGKVVDFERVFFDGFSRSKA
ncbi:MAG TPA: MGMT family protein [Methanomassiliicoccales archaeon]|nr:MGMT family protein [Methanomassiliicoccales archaeon]